MENPTAFDLNNAIQRWRESLGQSPHLSRDDLAELEAHLRDSAATLETKGLTGEEAFWVAARRLGSPARLEPEFAQVNRREVWLNRCLWMLMGIQGWWLLTLLARLGADGAIIGGFAAFGHGTFSGMSLLSVSLFTLINLVAFGVTVLGCWWVVRQNRDRIRKLAEKASRRPVLGGLALLGLYLVINALAQSRYPILMHYFSREAVALVSIPMAVGASVLVLLQAVALVILTILVLRRVRLGSAW